jgi:cellular nucleic acid-binding protein
MARGPTAVFSNMVSNPYPKAKEHVARISLCELCDREILTKDWNGHKNSKKHCEAEAKEREELEKAKNPAGTFGGDATSFGGGNEFSGTNEFGSGGDTFGGATTTANDGWGSAGDFSTANTTSYNSNGGGGDRACFGCGQTGHQKRDCPSGGGGGGGDRACFGCGMTGHQKRDCPQGSGGQACFNCGETG